MLGFVLAIILKWSFCYNIWIFFVFFLLFLKSAESQAETSQYTAWITNAASEEFNIDDQKKSKITGLEFQSDYLEVKGEVQRNGSIKPIAILKGNYIWLGFILVLEKTEKQIRSSKGYMPLQLMSLQTKLNV